jgi:hypothetical protein
MFFASMFPIASIIYSLMYAITHKKRLLKRIAVPLLNQSNRGLSIHTLLQDDEDATADDSFRLMSLKKGISSSSEIDRGSSSYIEQPYMMMSSNPLNHSSNLIMQ